MSTSSRKMVSRLTRKDQGARARGAINVNSTRGAQIVQSFAFIRVHSRPNSANVPSVEFQIVLGFPGADTLVIGAPLDRPHAPVVLCVVNAERFLKHCVPGEFVQRSEE